jgi:hypothetical protein
MAPDPLTLPHTATAREKNVSHNHNGVFDDETDRLIFRPGQPVEKDAEGREAGVEAGPGSPTAAASSSGGSGDRIAADQKGANPVAAGTERANRSEADTKSDDSPQAAPASS